MTTRKRYDSRLKVQVALEAHSGSDDPETP
jgi:hypothetical protein